MAKNALIAFAASVAHDVGENVRVNVIRYVLYAVNIITKKIPCLFFIEE